MKDPADHYKEAQHLLDHGQPAEAQAEAALGLLAALLQFEVCGHGTRGFCRDCAKQDVSQVLRAHGL